jgi:hypothetical protein
MTASSTNSTSSADDIKYKQTRVESFVEAWINVFIGFWINFTANLVILPQFGFSSLTVATNFIIGLLYTVISVVRSYVIRRWAQEHLKRWVKKISAFIRRVFNVT